MLLASLTNDVASASVDRAASLSRAWRRRRSSSLGPKFIEYLRGEGVRPADPRGGSGGPPPEGRDADHGRGDRLPWRSRSRISCRSATRRASLSSAWPWARQPWASPYWTGSRSRSGARGFAARWKLLVQIALAVAVVRRLPQRRARSHVSSPSPLFGGDDPCGRRHAGHLPANRRLLERGPQPHGRPRRPGGRLMRDRAALPIRRSRSPTGQEGLGASLLRLPRGRLGRLPRL